MNDEEFLDRVREASGVESTDEAEGVAEAALATLGERISDGQAADLAAQLPEEVAEPLAEPPVAEAEEFPVDEFVDRVGERSPAENADPVAQSRAVVGAVADAVDESELRDAREQLPPEYDVVLRSGPTADPDEFVDRVADAADLDDGRAREAITAALATLGERVTGGQAEDLAVYLPEAFAGALVDADEAAATYSVSEFVEHVARRFESDPRAARAAAEAVLATLGEVVDERAYEETVQQLPDEYGVLFGGPGEGE